MERFAREDKRVARHLDVVRRKELLELVLGKMESLRDLEGREKRREKERVRDKKGKGVQREREKERGWGIF